MFLIITANFLVLNDYGVHFTEISKIHPNCHTVNVSDLYLDGYNKVKVLDGREILYIDDDHLSLAGAFYAKTRLSDAIVKLVSDL